MAGSVTLQLTTGSSEVGNFTIYCESADPGNEIAQNVSSASLAAGYCTDQICTQYVIKSNTNECQTQIVVYKDGPPPTPTPVPGVTPTATPIALPTLNNGFRFTAGNFVNQIFGFHRGTLFGCPSAFGFGTGISPTATQIALPGTGCYTGGAPYFFPIDKGFGIAGVGNASQYALTQFSYDSTGGTVTAGIINGNGFGNPGTVTLSGNIQGSNGTSGTWSCNFTVGFSYTDSLGVSYTPESTGQVFISGLVITHGVSYNITT